MAEFDPKPVAARIDLANEAEFELGGVKVRPADLALERNGERRKLQPRVMKVLLALAKAEPGVVSRDRLVELCWDGRVVGDDALSRCVVALRHLAQQFTPEPFAIETVRRVGHRLVVSPGQPDDFANASAGTSRGPSRAAKRTIASALAMILAVAVVIAWPGRRSWQPKNEVPTVLVAAAVNDGTSTAMARVLAIKLGSLQTVERASMRLVYEAEGKSKSSDLVLEVGRVADPAAFGADLMVRAAPSRAILWSKEFKQASRNTTDLNQQIAFTAARVLRCTLEGMNSRDRLSEQTLKTYINACAVLSDSQYEIGKTIQMLEDVVRTSPRFVAGWAKLLWVESVAVSNDFEELALRPDLARHVNSARELEPDLAEAYIAEYILTPQADFLRRSRLIDMAVIRNPNHALARVERSTFLQSIGRTNEALRDAGQAVRLDPLSSAVRDGYITSLAIAGRMDAAREELSKAERLWPGATSLAQARYRLHLRFGDPREALQLLRSGAINAPGAKLQEPFLLARIDPSSENIERAIHKGRNVLRANPVAIDSHMQALAEFGREEELLNVLLNWRHPNAMDSVTGVLFRPAFVKLHRDPRFMRVAQHLGLLGYWRTTGRWPDLCIAPELPFDCKAEAARLTTRATA